nr:glutamate synthase subunit beta [Actinomycetales bacterium]
MGDRGFLEHRERELPPRRPIGVRIRDWRDVYADREPDSPVLRRQASRCMDCGVPFCHTGCPLGNLIPDWNTLVSQGAWAEAIERLHATNNFPEFTGRLCPAPCEDACVLGISQPAVTIKNVELHIIEEAFARGLVRPEPPDQLTDTTVAVVGSGPAGLAAAQQLTRAGHTVAVFERDDAIGGLMRYGIPEFKQETSVLERRLGQMRAEGTVFRPGVDLGSQGHPSGADLLERYDAIVVATGAPVHRELAIAGRDLAGIHLAMDYLPQGNRQARGEEVEDQITAAGKDVVIIGGGDTGSDCVGTAVRQGARSITQLQYRSRPPEGRGDAEPWPTYPNLFRISTSHEEAGRREFSTVTERFVGEAGRVRALVVQDSEQVDGRAVGIPQSEREIPAQLVLLAMGFSGARREGIVEQLGLELDERGRIRRAEDYSTGVPGVYVVGDAGRGQSLIVWAIAEGRAAAAAVDAHLRGRRSELPAPLGAHTSQLRP